MFVPPHLSTTIQNFFTPLNPYSFKADFFKIEEVKINKDDKEKVKLENVWFYGISSKRYVLYTIDDKGNINILKHSLHGLGHLSNPFKTNKKEEKENWQKRIWLDILKLHYGQITELDLINEYQEMYAIRSLTVSTPNIMNRFKRINENKPYNQQIKPFNFFLVGEGTKKSEKGVIKPISPYNTDPQTIVYEPFIDYNTCKILQGIEYWKPLQDVIFNYINHPESKYDGDIGILKRKHIKPDKIIRLGKEANKIEPNKNNPTIYLNPTEIEEEIRQTTPKEAKKKGINKMTLWKIKKRLQEGKPLNLRTKNLQKLCN